MEIFVCDQRPSLRASDWFCPHVSYAIMANLLGPAAAEGIFSLAKKWGKEAPSILAEQSVKGFLQRIMINKCYQCSETFFS